MKKNLFLIGVAALLATNLAAQELLQPSRDWYNADELNIDIGGAAYTDWEEEDLAFNLGMRYFVTRQVGFGWDISMLQPRDNEDAGEQPGRGNDNLIYDLNLSGVYRVSFGPVAPYVLVGAGYNFHHYTWNANVGAGVEWRLQKSIALYGEAQQQFSTGGRDYDATQFRVGIRVNGILGPITLPWAKK